MPALTAHDVAFLKLQPAVLCVDCEVISHNNTDYCLACGSRALLSLSRVLGGSLQRESTTRLVSDEMLNRIVADVLGSSEIIGPGANLPAVAAQRVPRIQSAMQGVVEQACALTGADGAALAVSRGGQAVCTAQLGSAAPQIGVQVRPDHGISGLCLRTGHTLRCNHAHEDSQVDQQRCRVLGVQSVVVAPLVHVNAVVGILEVLSTDRYAFDDRDVATVQLLAGVMVLAMVRESRGFVSRKSRFLPD